MRLPYAQIWQSYLISFVKHGDPNVEKLNGAMRWEPAGEKMEILDFRYDGIVWDEDDQVPEKKCSFWQRAEYAPTWNVTTGT
jgi:hypothetical protein